MGKKKGKQSGSFGHKSKLAAYTLEINQCVSEHNLSSQQRKSGNVTSHQRNVSTTVQKNEQRKVLRLNHLKGLIRDRVMEDRGRDADFRRSRMTASVNSLALSRRRRDNSIKRKTQEDMPSSIGWLMNYDLRETLAGIKHSSSLEEVIFKTDGKKQNRHAVPSLQTLAIQALSPILNDFVACLGKEYVHERLGSLPGYHISALSVITQNVNDDAAFVLGAHSHIEGLVLNGPHNNYHVEEDYEDEESERCGTRFSVKGLLSMLILAVGDKRELHQNDAFIEKYQNDNEVVDCWEDLVEEAKIQDACMVQSAQTRSRLTRLELRNFNPNSVQDVIDFLLKLPQLTHLSLSGSFNAITGPQFLLWDASITAREDKEYVSFLDLFSNLEILDLSGCQWLHFDLLRSFVVRLQKKKELRRNADNKAVPGTSLKLICVGGNNDGYLNAHCGVLNEMLNSNPMICVGIPCPICS